MTVPFNSFSSSRAAKLGQETGAEAPQSHSAEALEILKMIVNVDRNDIGSVAGIRAMGFVRELRLTLAFGKPLNVTGKQLFFLRDIKDKLIDKGLV